MQSNDAIDVVTPVGGGISDLIPGCDGRSAGTAGALSDRQFKQRDQL
jgi:hypothetical protein